MTTFAVGHRVIVTDPAHGLIGYYGYITHKTAGHGLPGVPDPVWWVQLTGRVSTPASPCSMTAYDEGPWPFRVGEIEVAD